MKTFKEFLENLEETTTKYESGVTVKHSSSSMTINHPKHGTLKLKYDKNKGTYHHPEHGHLTHLKPFDNENNKMKILNDFEKHGPSLGKNR